MFSTNTAYSVLSMNWSLHTVITKDSNPEARSPNSSTFLEQKVSQLVQQFKCENDTKKTYITHFPIHNTSSDRPGIASLLDSTNAF